MGPSSSKSDQLTFKKDGRVDHHIVQVLTTRSSVIGHDHITFIEALGAVNLNAVSNRRI